MGFFGFGKKNKEKEQEKMKTGLEKTRTGFWWISCATVCTKRA